MYTMNVYGESQPVVEMGRRGIMYDYASIMTALNGAQKVPDGIEAPYLENKDKGVRIPMSSMLSDSGRANEVTMGRALASGFVFCQPTETGLNRIAYDIKKGETLIAKNGGELQPVTMDQIRKESDDLWENIRKKDKADVLVDKDNVSVLGIAVSEFDNAKADRDKLVESRKGKPRSFDTKEGRQTMLDLLAYRVKRETLGSNYSDNMTSDTTCFMETPDHQNRENPLAMSLGDIKRRLVAGDVFKHVSSHFGIDGSTYTSFDKDTGKIKSSQGMESWELCTFLKNSANYKSKAYNSSRQGEYEQLAAKIKSYMDEHEDIINDLITDDQIDDYYKDLYDNKCDRGMYGDNSEKFPDGDFDYARYDYIQIGPETTSPSKNDGRMPAGFSDIESSGKDDYQLN